MKNHKFIIFLLFCFVILNSGLSTEAAIQSADAQKKTGYPSVLQLNSTIIRNGPNEIRTRGIERLEVYFLSVFCNGDRYPTDHKFLSNDFVEFKYNKTFYHYFYPICVLNEYNVCADQDDIQIAYQGRPFVQHEKISMTDGSKIWVARGRQYYICEYKQNRMYTFYTREQFLEDLGINEEEYANMTESEKWDVDETQKTMTRKYLLNKWKEIQEYRITLAVKEKPIVVFGVMIIVVVGLLVLGKIVMKKHASAKFIKNLMQKKSELDEFIDL